MRLSAFSTSSTGTISGFINQLIPSRDDYLSIDYSGCSKITSVYFQASNSTLSALNFTGCKSATYISCQNQYALRSLNMTGCSALISLYVTNSILSSVVIPSDSFYDLQLQGNQQMKAVTLRGFNDRGSLQIIGSNALRNVDLSPVRPINIYVYSNATLSAITFGNSMSSAYNLIVSDNNLSAIDISSLVNLVIISAYNNSLTSITMPVGFTSRAGHVGEIYLNNNKLDTAALNNFFTNLGTYAGAYDVYGYGGTIRYGNNPGSATCNPSIATAKGWQPQNY